MDLISVLEDMYMSELNFTLSTFWDSGYTVELGDELNGFKEKSEMLCSFKEVACELIRMIKKHFPESDFSKKYTGEYVIELKRDKNINYSAFSALQG